MNNYFNTKFRYLLHFMFDVNPYYYQKISSALDHKGGNEFSVVLFC